MSGITIDGTRYSLAAADGRQFIIQRYRALRYMGVTPPDAKFVIAGVLLAASQWVGEQ